MQVKDIIREIEVFAPPFYQESYDNSGLQVGSPEASVQGILLCLDVTEAVLQEAIDKRCNLIVAHHPLLFSGLRNITGKNAVERMVRTAIKADLNIYAAHTNLDNVEQGVSYKMAEKIGMRADDCRILAPVNGKIFQLHTYVPAGDAENLREALFAAGAGRIGKYQECSFGVGGQGTFRPTEAANPTIGTAGGPREEVQEMRLEVLFEEEKQARVLQALREAHPYEEVAYGVTRLENSNQTRGSGLIGKLPEPVPVTDFLRLLKRQFKAEGIRHTALCRPMIETVALCGGSGSFLLAQARREQADIFISGDFKYHQFFEAEDQLIIADIGHYESEQFTIEIFSELIKKKFPNFAACLASVNTNPVNYF